MKHLLLVLFAVALLATSVSAQKQKPLTAAEVKKVMEAAKAKAPSTPVVTPKVAPKPSPAQLKKEAEEKAKKEAEAKVKVVKPITAAKPGGKFNPLEEAKKKAEAEKTEAAIKKIVDANKAKKK